ncbi:MAG: YceD family protein [Devosia sp.]
MKDQPEPLFDAIVRIDKLPTAGRTISVNADEATRARVAEDMKLLAVERFVADLTVAPFRGGLRAQGRLKARIVQASIVSFEPVPQNIDEEVDRVFLPVNQTAKAPAPGTEIFIDLEDDDFPDHIDGPEVDLSALLIETLALAIDPYPRREGEDLAAIGIKAVEDDSGPFAALRGLKDKGET